MVLLKNDFLEIELNPKGAEIIKIIGQKDGLNYMWKRDPELWASSAPILFPIVGALQNNECRIENKVYSMTQHGFSRHNVYETHCINEHCVEFELTSNDEIFKQYPYLFDLKVIYTLNNNQLECLCKVKNIDQKKIYFQIGGHPAFACPLMENESSNDYYIEFEKNESLEQKIIDVEHRGMSHDTTLLFDNEKRFFVRQALFNNDAIVVKNMKSNYVTLKSLNHDKSLRFYMENFNHLGLWTSKHVGGLLAIEPWVGHSDYVDFKGEFKDKEGIVSLDINEEFICKFIIEINQ
ncbi:MAG: aldose 1-epimerase family protein [Coprobacillus sp.]|nr:aldose 1-epimerase family protein [Coprobacillus sp.]MCI9093186.1 aldose 1-epimerase family protein [Coprobacillus sp.]